MTKVHLVSADISGTTTPSPSIGAQAVPFGREFFDRFSKVNAANALMATFRVNSSIYGDTEVSDADYERASDALAIAHGLAVSDAYQEHEYPGLTLRVPFFDEALAKEYLDAYVDEVNSLSMDDSYPSNPKGHTLYCPRGCNVLHTTSGYDECAACGCFMTPDARDSFEDSLEAAGQI